MENIFTVNDHLCSLLKLKFNSLILNIEIISSSGEYESVYNDPPKNIIDDIDTISTLFKLLVKEMNNNCRKVYCLRRYLENNNKKDLDIKFQHCFKSFRRWNLCLSCEDAEDVMIEIDQLSYLEDIQLIKNEDIKKYVECLHRIDLNQHNLLYGIQKLNNEFSELFIQREREKYQKTQENKSDERNENNKNNQCSICLNPRQNDTFLECGHGYCFECIKTAINKSINSKWKCPDCRHPIDKKWSDSIVGDISSISSP